MAIEQNQAEASRLSRVIEASFVGGAIAGALDITYAFTVWGMRGVDPLRILQSVASGVLGRDAARSGGIETGLLGAALHFSMTLAMALVFVVASLMLPVLRRAPTVWGMAYGGGIYLVMNYIVVPLSLAASKGPPPPLEVYLSGLAVHVLLVGLPIALVARMYLPAEQR